MEINCPLIFASPYVDTEDYISMTPNDSTATNFFTSKQHIEEIKELNLP